MSQPVPSRQGVHCRREGEGGEGGEGGERGGEENGEGGGGGGGGGGEDSIYFLRIRSIYTCF